MKPNWKVIGISALVTGALIYPAYKLIQYLSKQMANTDQKENDDHHIVKAFVPAFRGKRHKHHDHN